MRRPARRASPSAPATARAHVAGRIPAGREDKPLRLPVMPFAIVQCVLRAVDSTHAHRRTRLRLSADAGQRANPRQRHGLGECLPARPNPPPKKRREKEKRRRRRRPRLRISKWRVNGIAPAVRIQFAPLMNLGPARRRDLPRQQRAPFPFEQDAPHDGSGDREVLPRAHGRCQIRHGTMTPPGAGRFPRRSIVGTPASLSSFPFAILGSAHRQTRGLPSISATNLHGNRPVKRNGYGGCESDRPCRGNSPEKLRSRSRALRKIGKTEAKFQPVGARAPPSRPIVRLGAPHWR